jgi:hypothetical protein
VAITVLVVQTTSISAAGAVLTDLVQVVEMADPLVIPDDVFAYTMVEAEVLAEVAEDSLGIDIGHDTLFYILPYTLERWTGDQGTVQVQKKVHQPRFFSAEDEAAYDAAGFAAADQVGETVDITQLETNRALDEEWSTDPDQLEADIRARVGDDDIALLEECLMLLREPLLPLDLRSAVLEVVAGLDLELVEKGEGGGGTFSIAYELDEVGRRQLTFTLDADGYLIFEEVVVVDGYPDDGVPPGTAELSQTHRVPVLVDGLP